MIAWLQILNHLETYLKDRVEARIEQGYSRNEVLPEPPVVKLYRSTESGVDIWTRPKGTLIIAMDLWEGSEGTEAKAANEALASLEELVQEALKTWPKQLATDLKMKITDVSFGDIAGDGENFRPQAAAFYKVIISWSK